MTPAGFQTLTLSFDPRGVATLALASTFDDVMVDELMWAFAMLTADARVRVIVLSAAGHGSSNARMLSDADRVAAMMLAIHDCPKPVIASVRGTARGGVVGLCCVCDIVMASPGARFAIGEDRADVAPAAIAPYLLNVIGRREAQRLSLTAEEIDAARAVELQLVTEVVTDQELGAAVERLAAMMLVGEPESMSETKALFRQLAAGPMSAAAREWTVRAVAGAEPASASQDVAAKAAVAPDQGQGPVFGPRVANAR